MPDNNHIISFCQKEKKKKKTIAAVLKADDASLPVGAPLQINHARTAFACTATLTQMSDV